ncbi:hypothetical protein LCGC14_0534670 [marine sediment metagenome]|uniref:Uncharacterized protein n=1 Tax=marine sediment metagenome TaxID=412755 RepID=A0A0F9UG10_9ZZZZ
MVKSINIILDDEEFKALDKTKGEELTWREFILMKAGVSLGKNGEIT